MVRDVGGGLAIWTISYKCWDILFPIVSRDLVEEKDAYIQS